MMRIRLLSRALWLSTVLFLVPPAFAADLRITDSSDAAVLVRDAVIDYGAFSSDRETEGVRILQGEATVNARWTNIETLTVTGTDESATPPRIRVEILLKNGQKVSGGLLRKGRMKLSGTTDLGDYSIDLEKVRTITPVHTIPRKETR
jgi:hypothetical protein